MRECSVSDGFVEARRGHRRVSEDYYSVEFSLRGLDVSYQFKIWSMDPASICVLVREDSDVLRRLKVGDVLNMKYYSNSSIDPHDYLRTAITQITKTDNGRFKGHYVVGLEIIGKQHHQSVSGF